MSKDKAGKFQLTHIRTYQVLKIEDRFDEEIKFFMPPAQGRGPILSIEAIILIKLMRIVDADYVFEFGTFLGLTTRLLLENLPDKKIEGERIFTLDLPSIEGIEFQGSDAETAKNAIGSERKYMKSKKKNLVNQILQDCLTFDEQQYKGKFQLIFIDGNHAISYVRSDTEKSFTMMAKSPSCIVWHDYGNPDFPELTAYIENLATTKKIYHVENTMLTFYLTGKDVEPRNKV